MRGTLSLQTALRLTLVLVFVPFVAIATQDTQAKANQPQDPNNNSQKATVTPQDAEEPNEAANAVVISESPYLQAVREFADNVLTTGSNIY
ncbi:hypothetical protein ACFL5Z_09190 [Planctomycetota bacterium]